jgi:tRNA 5-methylaminomethyl-2-thiouridine biosynthesis bifunctional protein
LTSEPDPATPASWDADGVLRSLQFGDIYFSTTDGLAESRAVFLAGCGLPEAWRGRRAFCVGELGFGTGLNILALLDLWRVSREPGARLQVFSVEAFPLAEEDVRRALAAWPELTDLGERLLVQWPRRARGFHRLDFEAEGAFVDLAIMEAGEALKAWTGAADAWFLDGFSPASNPDMWRPEVLAGVAARSAPGARAATFTVAGAVRRGLADVGYIVDKRPGFGRKSERLEARLPPPDPAPAPISRPAPRVAIIGAGIAGAALCRAFRALGAEPLVIEAETPGAGASGNPAALVMPRLDAGGGPVAQLYAQALARAADLMSRCPGALIAQGAVQLEVAAKDSARFEAIAAQDVFEHKALARLTAMEVAAALGEPEGPRGLAIRDARVVEPAALLARWLVHAKIVPASVAGLEHDGAAWRLLGPGGAEIARAEIVCIAAGVGGRVLAPSLPLYAVRGQVSLAAGPSAIAASNGEGYAIPTRDGFLFGATHDHDDEGIDTRTADHGRNLAQMARSRPRLTAQLGASLLSGRASLRAATPDFLPLAGPVPDLRPGLFILSGLGSRGFCAAPLLGEHVAALALGFASPLPQALAEIVEPARFIRRRARRLGRQMPGRPTATPRRRAHRE